MRPAFAAQWTVAVATSVVSAMLGLAAFPAAAAVPDPRFSVYDPVLVGTPSGTPVLCNFTPGPGYNVTVRDVNNAPIAGSVVTIDFTNAPGLNLFSQQESGTTLNCAARTISRVTNGVGRVVFAPRFGGYNNGNVVSVSADGVFLVLVPARSPDVLATGGRADLPDFAAFAAAYMCATCPQFDFDNSGGPIGLNDLAIMSKEYLAFPPIVAYCW